MRFGYTFLICGLLHVTACAQPATSRPGNPYMPGYPKQLTERLVGSGLHDWVLVDNQMSSSAFLQTFVPPGQTIETSPEIVTRVNVIRLPVDQKPEELLGTSEKLTSACDNLRRGEPKVIRHNNYPTASATVMCGSGQNGQGYVGVIHVIVRNPGSAGLTHRIVRVPPFDIANPPSAVHKKQEELVKWIDGLIFCDRGNPKHPCPPGT